MTFWIGRAIVAAAGIAAALTFATGARTEPVKVRISWVAIPNNLPPLLMEKPELMTRSGQSYVVDAVRLPDAAKSVAALASSDIDIALLTFPSLAAAIHSAKLEDLRIIGDEFSEGMQGHYSAEFLVLKDGPIKAIEDIKGKSAAVNARGGSTDMALRAITRRHKLDEKRDFTQVDVTFANMKAALLEKQVDLIGLGLPALSADPALREVTRTLFTQRDSLGPTAQVVWVARESFLQRNRAVIVEFMADALRVRQYFTDPKNRHDVVGIVSRAIKQPAAQLDPWLFTKNDFYRSPDGIPDMDVLQDNINKMVQLGFIKSGVDTKKYQDFSIVKEAAGKLK